MVGLVVALGLAASILLLTTYILNGGYSDKAQADALARASRMYLFGQVSGALLIAAMLAGDLSFKTMFMVAGILLLIAFVFSLLTTKPLEARLHATMDQQEAAGRQAVDTDKIRLSLQEQLLSPFGRVLIGIFLV